MAEMPATTTVTVEAEDEGGLRLRGMETVRWFHPDDAVDGQIVIVSGGIGYRKGKDWFTLTGKEWPGTPIQWEVTAWTPILFAPDVLCHDPARYNRGECCGTGECTAPRLGPDRLPVCGTGRMG